MGRRKVAAPATRGRRMVQAPAPAQLHLATVRPGPVAVFAYGSNTVAEQMRTRCPSATALAMPVRLPEHRLEFVGHSRSWGGAVATVEPCRRASVDGVVYFVSEADLHRLDGYEGAPAVYRRELMLVHGWKHAIWAWVYMHNAVRPGVPSYRYFAACVAGRVEHGLETAPVVEAAERAADACDMAATESTEAMERALWDALDDGCDWEGERR